MGCKDGGRLTPGSKRASVPGKSRLCPPAPSARTSSLAAFAPPPPPPPPREGVRKDNSLKGGKRKHYSRCVRPSSPVSNPLLCLLIQLSVGKHATASVLNQRGLLFSGEAGLACDSETTAPAPLIRCSGAIPASLLFLICLQRREAAGPMPVERLPRVREVFFFVFFFNKGGTDVWGP